MCWKPPYLNEVLGVLLVLENVEESGRKDEIRSQ